MNRDKLVKNILDEMRRIKEEKGIDILSPKMPDKDLENWVDLLVRQFWEK